jgi:hypothetical protein
MPTVKLKLTSAFRPRTMFTGLSTGAALALRGFKIVAIHRRPESGQISVEFESTADVVAERNAYQAQVDALIAGAPPETSARNRAYQR